MPYLKKRNFNVKKKRKFIKKRIISKAKAPLRRALTPFPKTRMVKLRYVTNVSLDASIGATTSYAFRSNDLYDPDYSGTGAQPYYFDQLMQMYNKFTVVGSKIMCTPFGSNTTGDAVIFGIYRDNDTTARTANLVESMEAPGTKWIGVGDNNQNPRRLTLTYSAKKVHGKNPIANPNLAGTASASPTDQDFFRIFCGSPNTSQNPGAVYVNVVIEYTALLHDRIDPATS